MKKRVFIVIAYTVFIAVISALITTAWFHYFVLTQPGGNAQKALIAMPADKIAKSPIVEGSDIIEIFSYGCHYCEVNEENVDALRKSLPAGKSLVRLHFNLDKPEEMARSAPVFATLQVMGIEEAHRQSAYQAVIDNKINLADAVQRTAWLEVNNINVIEYNKVSQSSEVKALLDYMARVTQHYNVRATPAFIVNKKWVALQDRDFPLFSERLISLLASDRVVDKP